MLFRSFSPDGRWIAYYANDSGQFQVYVQPASRAADSEKASPPAAGKWQISTDGGDTPRWARHGRELFYRNGDKVMAVAVESGGGSPGLSAPGRRRCCLRAASKGPGRKPLQLGPTTCP